MELAVVSILARLSGHCNFSTGNWSRGSVSILARLSGRCDSVVVVDTVVSILARLSGRCDPRLRNTRQAIIAFQSSPAEAGTSLPKLVGTYP